MKNIWAIYYIFKQLTKKNYLNLLKRIFIYIYIYINIYKTKNMPLSTITSTNEREKKIITKQKI